MTHVPHPWRRRVAVSVGATLAVSTFAASTAHANPGGTGVPGTSAGAGTVVITSARTLAEGQQLCFGGDGFGPDGNGVLNQVAVKLDAYNGAIGYTGSGVTDATLGSVATAQREANGTVSGCVLVPSDIDDPSVNNALTPQTPPVPAALVTSTSHYVRLLGGALGGPGLSVYSDDFEVNNAAPALQATAALTGAGATASSSSVTVPLALSNFGASEAVSAKVFTGLNGTTPEYTDLLFAASTPGGSATSSVTTDASGAVASTRITATVAAGTLPAGTHQIHLTGATSGRVAIVQVTVPPAFVFRGIAQGANGTVTLANAPTGTTISSIKLDSDGDTATTADLVEILPAEFTKADASTVSNAITVTVPADQPTGYGKPVVVTISKPIARTLTFTTKVSPNPAAVNANSFSVSESAAGAVAEGLYQSAYSADNDVVFATTAYRTDGQWDGKLYKLDPDTLAVLDEQRAPLVGTGPARYAPYGVGVDDVNNTVWVTNTRQNSVAVYDQDTLDLLKQFEGGANGFSGDLIATGYVSHARDAIYDPATNRVFVSSASEGTTGNGAIAVFEGGDNDGDGVSYEKIQDVSTGPRTSFSPMSLELAGGKVYTTSLSTSKLGVVDTTALTFTSYDLPGLTDLGTRGASGIGVVEELGRIYIASQDNDQLLITDLTGNTIKAVPAGAGSLNVAIDEVDDLVYVTNFGGATVSVFDYDGNLVANLPVTTPNHVVEDGQGSVYVVNKAAGNQVFKITPADFASTEPGRYWDTRNEPTFDAAHSNTGRLAAGGSYEIQIAGRGDIPADAAGVVANLTVINPDAPGFATVHPCVEGAPTTSSVNYLAGEVLANNVIVPLTENGTVCVYTLAGADFALDVNGFVSDYSPQVGITPTRFVDTRTTGTPLGAGQILTVDVTGSDLVPDDAVAAIVNLTAVTPAGDGYLTAYPCTAEVPQASTVNYLAGQYVPNGAVVDLSDDGKLCVYSLSQVDVLVDVTGYVPAGVDSVTPLTPGRLFDSRAGEKLTDGTAAGPRLAAGQWVEVDVAGRHGIPDTASAAFFNVAVVLPDGPGFVALSPEGGSGAPASSNLNHATGGVVRANNAVTQLSGTGTVWIYTLSGADVVLDVTGFVE